MHCRLVLDVPLLPQTQTENKIAKAPNDNNHEKKKNTTPSIILLQIDTYVIKGCALRNQSSLYPGQTTIQGNPDVRSITAKIDCLLLRPLASLGNGQFGKVGRIFHMGRPRPLSKKGYNRAFSKSQTLINSCNPRNGDSNDISNDVTENELNGETCNNVDWESSAMWEIDDLTAAESQSPNAMGDGETITYTYRIDSCCPLGYNPMKQVVCPRFIGWISTYEPHSLINNNGNDTHSKRGTTSLIPHISPYSFFIDVARGSRPMVAFAACPRSDEFNNSDDKESNPEEKDQSGAQWKDAQRDAEQTGLFCVNLVSEDLAWAMNASAAPLGKGLSEFRLMEGGGSCSENANDRRRQSQQRTIPTPVPAPNVTAPFVSQSPMFMECRYVKTSEPVETIKIPDIFEGDSMYSLIVGEVINIHIRKDCTDPKPGIEKDIE
ncbi:hypothetical protein ACHAXR_001394, partial [Thalassiosira sp. AJA248-18]